MCFCSQMTRANPLVAVIGEGLRWVFQKTRSTFVVSVGDIVGGR